MVRRQMGWPSCCVVSVSGNIKAMTFENEHKAEAACANFSFSTYYAKQLPRHCNLITRSIIALIALGNSPPFSKCRCVINLASRGFPTFPRISCAFSRVSVEWVSAAPAVHAGGSTRFNIHQSSGIAEDVAGIGTGRRAPAP